MKQQRLLATAPEGRRPRTTSPASSRRSLQPVVSRDAPPDDGLLAALRGAGVADVDDSGAGPGAVLLRRLAVPGAAAGRRPAAARRRVVATLDGLPGARRPADHARRRARRSPATRSGPGVVVDTSRHLSRVLDVDPEARTATVEPGVVQAALQRAAAAARAALRPRPEHAQPLHDRRDDRQQRLRLPGAGLRPDVGQRRRPRRRHRRRATRLRLGDGAPAAGVLADLQRAGRRATSATIRTEFGRFGRQVSGYSLEHLLPERGFDVARALVGSEGTLALVLGATVRLVADAAVPRRWSCSATRRWPTPPTPPRRCCRTRPTAVEGLDARIVQRLRDVPAAVVPDLPRGEGWLIVELTGDDASPRSRRPARGVVADAGALDALVVTDPARGGGDLADPRGRRRAGRPHQRRAARARRLGGRRRPARAAGRLPARVRGAARRARAAGRAVRPLRRRLRARADRLPVRRRRRTAAGRALPRLRRRTPPGWSPATAARCPASTATAGPAASCCR